MARQAPTFFRKEDGTWALPRFNLDKIRQFAVEIPQYGEDLSSKSYGLALVILQTCFGYSWVEKHILDEPKTGFFARHLGDHYGTNLVMHRISDIAETILNLLSTPGIDAPLEQLANGQIESGIAEIGVGKLLLRRGLVFQFIRPSGKKGDDFDILVKLANGYEVCLDAKCKYEEKAFSASSVINTLNDARKRNLPKGRPGSIFMKIPHEWVRDQEVFSAMERAIWAFLKGTRRIVSVQVYASILDLGEHVVTTGEWGWEYVNPQHEFSSISDWTMFGLKGGTLQPATGWVTLLSLIGVEPRTGSWPGRQDFGQDRLDNGL